MKPRTDRERVSVLRDATKMALNFLRAKGHGGTPAHIDTRQADYLAKQLEHALDTAAVTKAKRREDDTPLLPFPDHTEAK